MNNLEELNELTHYGIPGMKWGKRKIRAVGNKLRNKKRKMDYKKFNNKTLERKVQRLRLENEYRHLKNKDRQRGVAYVNSILAYGTAATAVVGLAKSPIGKKITAAILRR